MNIKRKLKNKRNAYIAKNIVNKYSDGIPLNSDEHHFLEWHQTLLSNPHLESAAEYYLKHNAHPYSDRQTFLLRHEKINKADIAKLKRRLGILLADKNCLNESLDNDNFTNKSANNSGNQSNNITMKMSSEQFKKFKHLTFGDLIFFHGNQLLTGAPFFPGGIAPTVFFQWGNLFGIAKYVILPEERALKSNVLIYFEDILERKLEECVHHFNDNSNHTFKNVIAQVNHFQDHLSQHHVNTTAPASAPSLYNSKIINNKE